MNERDQVAQLKAAIEALAHDVGRSFASRNEFGDEHTVIANGEIKPEGEPAAEWPGLELACSRSLEAATLLATHHRGSHIILYWRREPELEGEYLSMRLSFAT